MKLAREGTKTLLRHRQNVQEESLRVSRQHPETRMSCLRAMKRCATGRHDEGGQRRGEGRDVHNPNASHAGLLEDQCQNARHDRIDMPSLNSRSDMPPQKGHA